MNGPPTSIRTRPASVWNAVTFAKVATNATPGATSSICWSAASGCCSKVERSPSHSRSARSEILPMPETSRARKNGATRRFSGNPAIRSSGWQPAGRRRRASPGAGLEAGVELRGAAAQDLALLGMGEDVEVAALDAAHHATGDLGGRDHAADHLAGVGDDERLSGVAQLD